MAAAALRQALAEVGLADAVHVASAGISATEGDPINPRARAVLAAHGIAAEGAARRLTRAMLAEADLVLGLDRATRDAIEVLAGRELPAQICLWMSFAAGLDQGADVPDPYGTDHYAATFGLIQAGVAGLLAHIQAQWGGKA
jgi:protein-tyrosine-phosphatase